MKDQHLFSQNPGQPYSVGQATVSMVQLFSRPAIVANDDPETSFSEENTNYASYPQNSKEELIEGKLDTFIIACSRLEIYSLQ